ncbi:hypothetical protein ScPMuIL_011301 [Solemya velum]
MAVIHLGLALLTIGSFCVCQEPKETAHHVDKRNAGGPEIDVRLVDGPTRYEGRVEVRYHNGWGTICDDSWTDNEAVVVCRMLGLSTFLAKAVGNARYGEGNGTIWLDDVHCAGTEPTLAKCRHSQYGSHDCHHYEDAGVICHPGVVTRAELEAETLRLRGDGSRLVQLARDYDEKAQTVYRIIQLWQIQDSPEEAADPSQGDTFHGANMTSICPPLECATCPDGSKEVHDYNSACPYCYCANETNYVDTDDLTHHMATECHPATCPVCPYGFTVRHVTDSFCPYCYCARMNGKPLDTIGDYWKVTCPQPECPTCNDGQQFVWDLTRLCPTCSCSNGNHGNNESPLYTVPYTTTAKPGGPNLNPACPELACPPCSVGSYHRYEHYRTADGDLCTHCLCITGTTTWGVTTRKGRICPTPDCPTCVAGQRLRLHTSLGCPYCFCEDNEETRSDQYKSTHPLRNRRSVNYRTYRSSTDSYWQRTTRPYRTTYDYYRTNRPYSATAYPHWYPTTRPYWWSTTRYRTTTTACPPLICPQCPAGFEPEIMHSSACPICYCNTKHTSSGTSSGFSQSQFLQEVEDLQMRLKTLQNYTQVVEKELERLHVQIQSSRMEF